jgi:hypothetical protein
MITYHVLTLKLPGEGQMALPLNLNDKNIPNADFHQLGPLGRVGQRVNMSGCLYVCFKGGKGLL